MTTLALFFPNSDDPVEKCRPSAHPQDVAVTGFV
jgi:hypothetical protein